MTAASSASPASAASPATTAADVVAFWRRAGRDAWFRKDAGFDAAFGDHCRQLHFAAARRELDDWAATPEGALALLLLLDQYPRNCFRGSGHMYATDPLALHFARQTLERGFDAHIEPLLRPFCYMPFMHSESLVDQERCVALFEQLGGDSLPFARDHRDIVARFGRLPHRNPMLGRATTPDEQRFIDEGGFAG